MARKRRQQRPVQRSSPTRLRLDTFATGGYWPKTNLTPYIKKRHVVKSYMYTNATPAPRSYSTAALRQRAGVGRPRGWRVPRPQMPSTSSYSQSYGNLTPWALPTHRVIENPRTECARRSQRREVIFASTGGGRIRRKPHSIRTAKSDIRCN